MSMKNSNDTIGNRTCDLPTCSAVPQPTALPRAPGGCSKDIRRYGTVWLAALFSTIYNFRRVNTWPYPSAVSAADPSSHAVPTNREKEGPGVQWDAPHMGGKEKIQIEAFAIPGCCAAQCKKNRLLGPRTRDQQVEASVTSYQPTPRNTPEEQRPQLHHSRNLKSRKKKYSS